MKKFAIAVFSFLCIVGRAVCVWAQVIGAQVPEETVKTTLHVSKHHPQASDTNPGTAELPLKTIGKAVELAGINSGKNIGTKVLIAPGYYRESLAIWQQSDAPIVFEAKRQGQVFVVGSDIWTGWQRQGNTNIYTHSWPYDWGLADVPSDWQNDALAQKAFDPIVRRREMVFVNGQLLKQVLSYSALTEKSFYVDEINDTAYIWPSTGTNVATALIEVAVRPLLFLALENRNIVLRSLVFKHANSPLNTNAVYFGSSSHVLIEDCRFGSNNWGGIGLGNSQNVTVRRSVANYNGGIGMGAAFGKNFLFEDSETSLNNWRGVRAGYTGWSVAGLKHLFIHDAVYRRHKALDNKTVGFWLDSDSSNILIDSAFLHRNLMFGLFIEANQGPITVRMSTICHNQGAGILVNNSRDVTLEGNTLYRNKRTQILAEGSPPDGRLVTNWETGETMTLVSERWTLKENEIMGKDASQLLIELNLGGSSAPAWLAFKAGLRAEQNVWYNSAAQKVFKLFGWSLEERKVDFHGWQAITEQDQNSVFTDPLFADPDQHQS
jgi:hypothetical protein